MTTKTGKQVVAFTGESDFSGDVSANQNASRDFWKKVAEEAGFKVSSSITSETDLLVASYQAAKDGTTKWTAATEKGIQITSYEAFFFGHYHGTSADKKAAEYEDEVTALDLFDLV